MAIRAPDGANKRITLQGIQINICQPKACLPASLCPLDILFHGRRLLNKSHVAHGGMFWGYTIPTKENNEHIYSSTTPNPKTSNKRPGTKLQTSADSCIFTF